jgi:hypothetical protein
MSFKPIICFDFDGVLHSYESGWQSAKNIPDGPVKGAIPFLTAMVLAGKYSVSIYSARSAQKGGIIAMKEWLVKHGLDKDVLEDIDFPLAKPPAFLTIDDRVICFDGDFSTLYPKILGFKPWNKRRV